MLYVDLLRALGVRRSMQRARSRRSSSPPRSATATRSRNRVVDALGDLAGGVRLHEPRAMHVTTPSATQGIEMKINHGRETGKPSERRRRRSPARSGPTRCWTTRTTHDQQRLLRARCTHPLASARGGQILHVLERPGAGLLARRRAASDPSRRHRLLPAGRGALARRRRRQLPAPPGDLARRTDWLDL